MNSIFTLTAIYIRQLQRSKSTWIVLLIFAGMFIINYYVQSRFEEALKDGVSYDVATRQASSALKQLTDQIRGYSVMLIIIISALIAPESRKNGTTQFVISLSVNRFKLALSQFLALSVFVILSVFIIHIGYIITASNLGIINYSEMLFSWVYLLFPLLIQSAVIFSFSISFSAIETYIVFLGVPYVVIELLNFGFSEISDYVPMLFIRFADNLRLLYLNVQDIIFWPRLSHGAVITDPPFPDWTWMTVHIVFSASFWILLGLWFYRNHDFGSRTAVK